jgi:phosphoglycolate phosphatase
MKRWSAVIFDFDGTLAELHLDFPAMKRKITAMGRMFLEEAIQEEPLPALEWAERLALRVERRLPEQSREFRSRCRLLITAMEMDAAAKGRLFPYAVDMLRRLRDHGIQTAVITRNCTAAVRRVFPDIDSCCHVFLPREDAPRIKPDPEHALEAARRLHVSPRACLLVGDHPIDVDTARRAGMASAAVTTGRTGEEELERCSPDYLRRNVADLDDILFSGD